MKRLTMKLALTLMTAAAVATGLAEKPAKKPLKVLMIGNSFSASVMRETPAFAKAAGVCLDICQAGIGGCPLDKHWQNVEKADDPSFKPYSVSWSYASAAKPEEAAIAKLGHKGNIPALLKADAWDIVTIQQASGKSFLPETYQPYADNLIATIRKLAPQAEIRIQETWSYSPYDSRLKANDMDPKGMHAKLKAAYRTLAERHGLKVIPTGDAAQLFRDRLPVVYDKVLTRKEIAALVQPAVIDFHGDVAGASHWGKGRKGRQKDWDQVKLRTDFSHFNARGHYLQAAVWTAALFDLDPTTVAYCPKDLSEADAKLMRECARDAVKAWR